jgi:transcription elongation factor GreA
MLAGVVTREQQIPVDEQPIASHFPFTRGRSRGKIVNQEFPADAGTDEQPVANPFSDWRFPFYGRDPGRSADAVDSEGAAPTMSSDRIPMTREGYEKLKADLERMQGPEMIEMAKRIAAARAHGDLSENAEYHAAREDQGMLQARIDALKDKLSRAYFIEKNHAATDEVVFGAKVRVLDLDLNEEETFELVGPGDEDYNHNRILITSPIGQGLLGKRVGEVAEVNAPMGVLKFEVKEISFPE